MHNISLSDIPFNISSMTNYQIVNEIKKLRAKLNADRYKQASELYKNVIKSININFVKSLYATSQYTSINNYDPLLDFDYLLKQYDNKNTIKNPALYKLLKENCLQRNLFKFIILTHFYNESNNKISDKMIAILKAYIGDRITVKKSGLRGGGEPFTEAQKKSLAAALVFVALSIDDKQTRDYIKTLIEELNSPYSKEIITKIDKIVTDPNILPENRYIETFKIMELSPVEEIKDKVSSSELHSIINEDPKRSSSDAAYEKLKEIEETNEMMKLKNELYETKTRLQVLEKDNLEKNAKILDIESIYRTISPSGSKIDPLPASTVILSPPSITVTSATKDKLLVNPASAIPTLATKDISSVSTASAIPTPATKDISSVSTASVRGGPPDLAKGTPPDLAKGGPLGPAIPPPPGAASGGPPMGPPPPMLNADPAPPKDSPSYQAWADRQKAKRLAREEADRKRQLKEAEEKEAREYNDKSLVKKVELLNKKAENYIDAIKEWINTKQFEPDFKKFPDKDYRQGDKQIYEKSIEEMMKKKVKIARFQEKNEDTRDTVANDDAVRLERVSRAEKILEEIKCEYNFIEEKYNKYVEKQKLKKLEDEKKKKEQMENEICNKNFVESLKTTKSETTKSETTESETAKSKKPVKPEDLIFIKLNKIGQKQYSTNFEITFNKYKKRILDLENKVIDIKKNNEINIKNKDKYIYKITANICEIINYIENIKKIFLDWDEVNHGDEFDKKKINVKTFNKYIDSAERDALRTASKAIPSVGGSLFYYQKYMKYKSKYLQIK